MVSAIVSDLFQAGSSTGAVWPETAYYPGVPESQVLGFTPTSQFGGVLQAIWGTTEEKYLQYTIAVDDEDISAAKSAAACHVSQWDAAALSDVSALLDASQGNMYLRKSATVGESKASLD